MSYEAHFLRRPVEAGKRKPLKGLEVCDLADARATVRVFSPLAPLSSKLGFILEET